MAESNPRQIVDIQEVLESFGVGSAQLAYSLFSELHPLEEHYDLTREEAADLKSAREDCLALLCKLDSLTNSVTLNRIAGEVSELTGLLEAVSTAIEADIKGRVRDNRRPTTYDGLRRLRMFDTLCAHDVTAPWTCSNMIARILLVTGVESGDYERLRNSVHQQLRNHLRK